MSILQKIFGNIRKANEQVAQQRLAVRGEVIALIVSEAAGRSQLTEADEGAQIAQAIEDGIIGETEAGQVYELATRGFGYIQTGELPFIDPEPLIAFHAALIQRHREEMRASLVAMREAEARNIEIGEARQQFQRLALQHPEVGQELCRQVKLSWSPRFTDEPIASDSPSNSNTGPQNHADAKGESKDLQPAASVLGSVDDV